MPNPTPPPSKRERLARFILRLRSKQTSGSSLVVQTGFPTSLADLVVKNRAKFKRRRKPSPSQSFDLDSAASATSRSDSDGAGERRAAAAESPDRIDGAIEAAPVAVRRGGGLGLEFLLVKVAVLVVLAVGRKRVVVGITVLTFGLLVLEVAGLLRLGWPKERNAIDERFDLGGRVLVCPIREVDVRPNSDDLDSKSEILLERGDFDAKISTVRSRELVSPIREIESESRWNSDNLDSKSGILLERRDFDAKISTVRSIERNGLRGMELVSPIREIEYESHQISLRSQSDGSENSGLGNSQESLRRKKLFRNLFKRKKRQKKSSSSLDDIRVRPEEVLTEAEEGSGNVDEVKDISDNEFLSFEGDDNHDTEVTEINSEEIRDNRGNIRLGRWRKLVFFFVLLGLLGGKSLALVLSLLTVGLYLLSRCTETVWMIRKMW